MQEKSFELSAGGLRSARLYFDCCKANIRGYPSNTKCFCDVYTCLEELWGPDCTFPRSVGRNRIRNPTFEGAIALRTQGDEQLQVCVCAVSRCGVFDGGVDPAAISGIPL